MAHSHLNQHLLITEIFQQIAKENNKSLERIKQLLLIQQNQAINQQFWRVLDNIIPQHNYNYVGCCAQCGQFELRK